MTLDEALVQIRNGRGLLFTGAGFSLGAANVRDAPLRTGQGFADELAAECGEAAGLALADVSEEFAAQFGEDALLLRLQDAFKAAKPADYHVQIAREPWLRTYTTNYDDLFELASGEAKLHVRPVSLTEDIRDVPKQQSLCVHVHGFVGRLTRSGLWDEIRLTDTSFSSHSITDSLWGTLFRQDLAKARCVVFVGWSVGDLDIKRVLSGSEDLKSKTFFVLGKKADKATIRRAERYGTVLLEDTSEFAERLKNVVVDPEDAAEETFLSWRQLSAAGTGDQLRDSNVLDLLLLGEVKRDHLYNSLHGGPRYVLERPWASRALEGLKRGRRGMVFYSGLANGKSLLLQTIGLRLVEQGYEVFEYLGRSNDDSLELDRILAVQNRKIAVLIDNYPGRLEVVRQFSLTAPKDAVLFVAARSAAHDLLVGDLAKILGDDFPESDIDTLTDPEVEWCIELFDQYGFWGDSAGWHRSRKREFVTNDCQRQWRGLLLKAFEAPQVVDRLNGLISECAVQRDQREALVALLILVSLNFSVTVDDLMTLWGADVVANRMFRANTAVRELISFESGQVRLKSAVAAEFVLRKSIDATTIVTVLFRLAKSANMAAPANGRYQEVLSSLMRYSSVAGLMPDKGKQEAVFRHYESLRSISFVRQGPLFWLQYGIAALTFDDFERAELNFKTAYALAEKTKFDPYQIDNHRARLLLRRAVVQKAQVAYMNDFRSAHKVVESQMRGDRHLNFPFRVARLYREFWDALLDLLDAGERAEVVAAIDSVLKRIGQLPPGRRAHYDVRQCEKELSALGTPIDDRTGGTSRPKGSE